MTIYDTSAKTNVCPDPVWKLSILCAPPTEELHPRLRHVDLGGNNFSYESGAVILEAADVIASGKSTVMEFGVADETAWEVGLACGGRIKIFVEPVTA